MKKLHWFTLLTLIALVSIFALYGCGEKEDIISSVSLKDHDPNTVIEIMSGDFDYNDYTVVVAYESGKTEDIALTEEMIAKTDILKLYQVGEHDITISYGKHEYTFKVSVKKATFGDLSFPENNVFTYDGKAHTIELDGNIPSNAVVTYIGGNSFVNAGTYDVTAIVSCEGYVTEKLSTTVKIERAKYDMSAVRLEGKEIVYDGNSHSIEIFGKLPEGVPAPRYTIDDKEISGVTDVGEYTVKATFVNNDPNYEAIPEMEATLKITPAEYDMKEVDIIFSGEDGEEIRDATKIYDGKGVTFDLDDYSKLSKKVSVSFSVCDKDGNVISTSNKSTGIVNVGVYTVNVEFTLENGKNYKPIAPLVYTFEVLKAEYPPIENIKLESAQATYDGKEHSIKIEGELPADVTVSYEYYLDGILVVDSDGNPVQSVVDAGIYAVKAVFSHNHENFEKIPDVLATLNIKKVEISLQSLGFFGEDSVEYSGQPYKPPFKTWKDAVGTDYDILQYSPVKYYVLKGEKYVEMGENELPVEVGSYRAIVEIRLAEEQKHRYNFDNGDDVQTSVKQFDILRKELEIPKVDIIGDFEQYEYSGKAHTVSYSCNADSDLISVSAAYFKYSAGNYVAMNGNEYPVNKGLYRFVVSVAVKDETRYVFASGETIESFSADFEILPREIDMSGLEFDNVKFSYNEKNQYPVINGVPEHVRMDVKLYSHDGKDPIEQTVNVGKYRCEIIFAAESYNYVLSTTEKLVTEYEIVPIKINVDGLEFASLTFSYDGDPHLPQFVTLPDHVNVHGSLFLIDPFGGYEIHIDEAIKVGKYIYKIWISAENSNYELVGKTNYTAEFNIITSGIVIADVDELLSQPDYYIELQYGDGLYHANEDDPFIKNDILNAVFGDNSSLVRFEADIGSPIDTVTGKPLHNFTGIEIDSSKIYTIECRIVVSDANKYNFFYNGAYVQSATITFRVKFVEEKP